MLIELKRIMMADESKYEKAITKRLTIMEPVKYLRARLSIDFMEALTKEELLVKLPKLVR